MPCRFRPALLLLVAFAANGMLAQSPIFSDDFESGDTSAWSASELGPPGAVQITKTTKNASLGPGDHPHQGVSFELRLNGALIASALTDASGQVCFDGLNPGATYTVHEIVPLGHAPASPNPQSVTISGDATCSEGSPDTRNFVNSPLSAIQITFYSLAGPGVTKVTSVQCSGPGLPPDEQGELQHGQSATITNLVEGTYNCAIVIDP